MIEIRNACSADLPAIGTLADQINRQHWRAHADIFVDPDLSGASEGGNDDSAGTAHTLFWQSCIDAPGSTMLVAQIGDSVVGFVSARILPVPDLPFLSPRQVCRIGTIVIDQAVRGQGVGAALMRAVEAWARQHAVVELRLEVFDFNRSAIRFYDTAGFAAQSHIMTKALR